MLVPVNLEALREEFDRASPFPFIKIDQLLDPAFAVEVAASYPSFDEAVVKGRTFTTVNERKKVQITDPALFPAPVAKLNDLLASPAFLSDLSEATGIPNLLADEELVGGGMHITGPGGRLDVHIDFNYLEARKLHRRLNLLLYLNPKWDQKWGGHLQLWDKHVKHCEQSFAPSLGRCVIFATSDTSFHGVTPVSEAAPFPRFSFATYYYTKEAPLNWKGHSHSTIFKARPEETFRQFVLMPAETIQRQIISSLRAVKKRIRRLVRYE